MFHDITAYNVLNHFAQNCSYGYWSVVYCFTFVSLTDPTFIIDSLTVKQSRLNIEPQSRELHRSGGVIVSVHALTVDREFVPQSGQTKNYKIVICCFSAKHAVLGRKCKYVLTRIRIICPSGVTCLDPRTIDLVS